MATKKQKRLEMEAKRAREAEETRLSGLKAQRVDRAARAMKAEKARQAAEDADRQAGALLELARQEKYAAERAKYKEDQARAAIKAMAPKP
jgi:hypothetical protein